MYTNLRPNLPPSALQDAGPSRACKALDKRGEEQGAGPSAITSWLQHYRSFCWNWVLHLTRWLLSQMSNERTLPESQGAEGGGSGHEEAQLQARGRQIKGDQLKVQGHRWRSRPAAGSSLGLSLLAGAQSKCINHNVPWANGQCRGSRPG